jgi:hypothetical protein
MPAQDQRKRSLRQLAAAILNIALRRHARAWRGHPAYFGQCLAVEMAGIRERSDAVGYAPAMT